MVHHSLLLIYRNFKRFKSTFFINLIGLSTGLACALLIFLWVNDELNIDKFHEKDRQLYQIMANHHETHGIRTIEPTPGLLAKALAEELPAIEYAAAVMSPYWETKDILSVNDTYIRARVQFVGKDFFNAFSYPLIQGEKNQVLSDKNAVVISEELAIKLFNTTENVVGKTIEWHRKRFRGSYLISGVFENLPSNASSKFDLLFSYALFLETYPHLEQWSNSDPRTYVVLEEGTNIDQFSAKISDFIKSKHEASNVTLFPKRYSEKHLYGRYENGLQAGGRIAYVRLFSIIALFLLAIACINFMNLSTAKASRRIKEVGIKKAVGASRKTLIFQYLSESVLMSFLSLIMALVLVDLFLPLFSELSDKQLTLTFDAPLILFVVGITVFTGFIAGSYPAFYLSGFNPALVLKGKVHQAVGEFWVRKGLVIFQFAISVILIVSVLVVYKQIEFVQSKNLGYHRDNIIHFSNEGRLEEDLETFLAEAKKIPGIVNASSFGHDLTGNHGSTSGLYWEGKNPDDIINFGNLEIGYDLIETLGFEMKEGRTFSRDFSSERSKIIFNEAAIEVMGLNDPVGKTIRLWGEDKEIVGVVKNFHFESLYEPVKPCFFQVFPNLNTVLVKIQAGLEKETLEQLRTLYQGYNLGLPFEYQFLDQEYQALYAAEKRVAVLSRYFAGLAILISCLGLFGLAAFTAQRRYKEIGIRKILGSSEWGIIYLLSSDFTKMVGASLLIALPISYVLASKWLDGFAYRIDVDLWYFMGAGLLTLFIAWFTVGLQTVKAARINPAHCLRDE